VLFEFIVGGAFALLIILGTNQSATLLAAAVGSRIDFTAPTVQGLFVLAPVPDTLGEDALLKAIGVAKSSLSDRRRKNRPLDTA